MPARRLYCRAGKAREVDPRSAGRGQAWMLLGCASFPPPPAVTSGAPEGRTEAIREPKDEARLTGSPEAVPAQRRVGSLARAPLSVVARSSEGCSEMR